MERAEYYKKRFNTQFTNIHQATLEGKSPEEIEQIKAGISEELYTNVKGHGNNVPMKYGLLDVEHACVESIQRKAEHIKTFVKRITGPEQPEAIRMTKGNIKFLLTGGSTGFSAYT